MLLLGLVLLVGLFLRLYNLDFKSLWFDEADVVLSSTSISDASKILDYHNPILFYRIFIFYWRHLSPYANEWLLRLPSVIFALGAIILIYKLTFILFGNKQVALISALLLCISPLHVYYSQEATCYSLIAFLSLATAYCFFNLPKRRGIYFSLYVALHLIGAYAHPIMLVVFLTQNLFLVIRRERFQKVIVKIILCDLVIILLYSPALYSILSGHEFLFIKDHFAFKRASVWIPVPAWRSLFFTLKNFTIGYNNPGFLYPAAVIFFLVSIIKGILNLIKKENGLMILIFLLAPILFIFTVGKITTFSYYVDRYFLCCLPFFCMTVAYSIHALNKKYLQIGTIFIITAISAINLNNYYRNVIPDDECRRHLGVVERKDIKKAAQYINEHLGPGDTLFHTCRNTALPFEYYFDFHFKKTTDIFKYYIERTDNKQKILSYFPQTNSLKVYKYAVLSEVFQDEIIELDDYEIPDNGIWLVFSSWLTPRPDDAESNTLSYMEKNYAKIREKRFKGITVYLYRKNKAFDDMI